MSKIFVLILEGDKSCTEFNFFNGMNHHTENVVVIPVGFHKAVKKSPQELNKRKLIDQVLNYIDEGSKLHFIADGDKEVAIPAIFQTHEDLKEVIDEFVDDYDMSIIYNDLIIYKNKKFEQVIGFKNAKDCSNVTLFNNFLEEKDMLVNGEVDIEKITKYFENTEIAELINNIFKNTED